MRYKPALQAIASPAMRVTKAGLRRTWSTLMVSAAALAAVGLITMLAPKWI